MKLMLGTAQFGLDYGISNKSGQTSEVEISKILKRALDAGIDFIDTARAYGNCEEVLASNKDLVSKFKIITKISSQENVRDQVLGSLKTLSRESFYGVLIHDTSNLVSTKNEAMESLLSLKNEGYIKKIGVSVYDEDQIEQVINRHKIDLIQVPTNVCDQRLVSSGWLKKLKDKDIEIHGRSLFLQGLFFLNTEELDSFFAPVVETLNRIDDLTKHSLVKKLGLLLGYGKNLGELSRLVVGVTSTNELNEIISAYNNSESYEYNEFAIENEKILNPSNWPSTNGN